MNVRPAWAEASEWALTKEEARRLRAIRFCVDRGWYTDDPPADERAERAAPDDRGAAPAG